MHNKPAHKISRRDAIKILTAAAGAVALANIPDQWTKPGMNVGVLPAHAQTSAGPRALAAGLSDPDANYCFPLISTATITPPDPAIVLRYTITLSAGLSLITPPALTGTVATNAVGVASLSIEVDEFSFVVGSLVSVLWEFDNPADGTGSGIQDFISGGAGC
jgi:hypothetical protein